MNDPMQVQEEFSSVADQVSGMRRQLVRRGFDGGAADQLVVITWKQVTETAAVTMRKELLEIEERVRNG